MPVHLTCPTCGTAFKRAPSRVRGGFCSSACAYAPPPPLVLLEGAIALIPLVNRQGTVLAHAIVDADDAPDVGRFTWRLSPEGYASRGTRVEGHYATVWLHRMLLGLGRYDEREGDHINRNRLDNRRSNLRAITKAGNRQNTSRHCGKTSQYRGVHLKTFSSGSTAWSASVRVGKRTIHVGYYRDEIAAAKAAQQARFRLLPYATD